MPTTKTSDAITTKFIQSVCDRLNENKAVRRTLPGWGRVHIDRPLPFLAIYRKPPERVDTGTERLLFGEAAFVMVSGESRHQPGIAKLLKAIVQAQTAHFDRFLIIELWTQSEHLQDSDSATQPTQPGFRIFAPPGDGMQSVVDRLNKSLNSISILKRSALVSVEPEDRAHPDGLRPVARRGDLASLGTTWMGLEIKPVFRDPKSQEIYPVILRSLHRSVARSLKRTFFEFTRTHTKHNAPHFSALGRQTVVKSAWQIDDQLAQVSNAFSLLLTVTPTNADSAFSAFKRRKYEKAPAFAYPPIPVDTSLLKRTLHGIPIERIEDPVMAQIFRMQLDDLDRRLTLISDRGTPRFLYGSLQTFGGVKDWIYRTAREVLKAPHSRGRDESKAGFVTSAEFANRVLDEFAHYKNVYEAFTASCRVTEQSSGLMVAKGALLIGKNLKVPNSRVKALIQHEVGTHLVTYYNGRAQPFKQLYVGLAGYDELQEGLAVLSEHLVGGLSKTRLRLLAARVIAVRRLIEGASFVETFRELDDTWDFEKRTAFMITMRVFRGGGLTKDATYLKGLVKLLKYLSEGGDFESLYLGKFNLEHLPLIKELEYRNILNPVPLLPRYINDTLTRERLARLRSSISLSDLINTDSARRATK